MDLRFSKNEGDKFLSKLKTEYDIYAPKAFKGEGRYSDSDCIRYGKIETFSEVVYDKKSDYSAKEVLVPMNHLYAVKIDDIVVKQEYKEKKKIIILRSCDMHAIKRLDKKFFKDDYYLERRKNIKFMIMGCPKAFDNCTCVSLGTNKIDGYNLAVEFLEDGILLKVNDHEFDKFIEKDYEEANFEVKFADKNILSINKPKIETWDFRTAIKIKEMEFWNEYKNRCVGCGSCNAVCPTCTCLITKEIKSETSNVIEVRRIWNGCQLVKKHSLVNHSLKEIIPARVRQRVLDKFYMPRVEEHGEQECVGCGRCTDICPRLISFTDTVNRLTEELHK